MGENGTIIAHRFRLFMGKAPIHLETRRVLGKSSGGGKLDQSSEANVVEQVMGQQIRGTPYQEGDQNLLIQVSDEEGTLVG